MNRPRIDVALQRATPCHGPLAPDSVIAERYRVLHMLGQGGMGVVYLAEHIAIGRKVAIKLITPRWARDPTIKRRFRAEPRLASAAGHPNIVEVFDAGELPDGSLYIVMEFLSGETLRDYIKREGPLSEQEACHLIIDVAAAVSAAHRVGVIHRDLKLDNIMLADLGGTRVLKVLDFGLASELEPDDSSRLTRPGRALGTPAYMAPEQMAGARSAKESDIYALGAVLFTLLVGRGPFAGIPVNALYEIKRQRHAPSIYTLRKDLSIELAGLIADCLEIDPSRRPPSVDAFLERLAEVPIEWSLKSHIAAWTMTAGARESAHEPALRRPSPTSSELETIVRDALAEKPQRTATLTPAGGSSSSAQALLDAATTRLRLVGSQVAREPDAPRPRCPELDIDTRRIEPARSTDEHPTHRGRPLPSSLDEEPTHALPPIDASERRRFTSLAPYAGVISNALAIVVAVTLVAVISVLGADQDDAPADPPSATRLAHAGTLAPADPPSAPTPHDEDRAQGRDSVQTTPASAGPAADHVTVRVASETTSDTARRADVERPAETPNPTDEPAKTRGDSAERPTPTVKVPVDDEASARRSTKNRAWKTASCEAKRSDAQRARDDHKWFELEQLTRARACWRRALDRDRLRTQALLELGDYDGCIKQGARARDRQVARTVAICRGRKQP